MFLGVGLGAASYAAVPVSATVPTVAFGEFTAVGAGGVAMPLADGAYGDFDVVAGIMVPNGPLTAGVQDLGSVVVTVIAGARSVADNTELRTALGTQGSATRILMRPGDYSLTTPAHSFGILYTQDRSANPSVLCSHDPANKARFLDSYSYIQGAHHWTLENIVFEQTQADIDANGRKTFLQDNTGVHDFTIGTGVEFRGPDQSNATLTDPTPRPAGIPLPTGFVISSANSHSNVIDGAIFRNVWQCGTLMLNGASAIRNVDADIIYYDAFQMIAPTNGGVGGTVELIGNRISNFVGVADELSGVAAPHCDFFQIYNGAGDCWIPSMRVHRNILVPGTLRADFVQCGLTQAHVKDYKSWENIFLTKGTPHGTSLEYGSEGAMFWNNTFAEQSKSPNCNIRLYKRGTRSHEDVLVGNCAIAAASIDDTGAFPNDAAVYDLVTINSVQGADQSAIYAPGSGPSTSAEAIAMFTPAAGQVLDTTGIGALDASGAWRGGLTPPMRAAAPALAATVPGQIDVTRAAPADDGGSAIASHDLKYRPVSGGPWTLVQGIAASQAITGLPDGSAYEVKTRAVNAEGAGVWTRAATITTAGTTGLARPEVLEVAAVYGTNAALTMPAFDLPAGSNRFVITFILSFDAQQAVASYGPVTEGGVNNGNLHGAAAVQTAAPHPSDFEVIGFYGFHETNKTGGGGMDVGAIDPAFNGGVPERCAIVRVVVGNVDPAASIAVSKGNGVAGNSAVTPPSADSLLVGIGVLSAASGGTWTALTEHTGGQFADAPNNLNQWSVGTFAPTDTSPVTPAFGDGGTSRGAQITVAFNGV